MPGKHKTNNKKIEKKKNSPVVKVLTRNPFLRVIKMLDTESGSTAELVFRRLGWTEVGQIPNFSLSPGGDLRSETFFYKQL